MAGALQRCRALFQAGESIAYAGHSGCELLLGGGVAQADVAGEEECRTGHGGHVGLFEQIHSHLRVGGDGAAGGTTRLVTSTT